MHSSILTVQHQLMRHLAIKVPPPTLPRLSSDTIQPRQRGLAFWDHFLRGTSASLVGSSLTVIKSGVVTASDIAQQLHLAREALGQHSCAEHSWRRRCHSHIPPPSLRLLTTPGLEQLRTQAAGRQSARRSPGSRSGWEGRWGGWSG